MSKSFVIVGKNGRNDVRAMLVQGALKRKGYSAAHYHDISELLGAFCDHESMNGKPFDVVILVGCNLENGNKGIGKLLSANYPDIKILFLSKETTIEGFLNQEVVNVQ